MYKKRIIGGNCYFMGRKLDVGEIVTVASKLAYGSKAVDEGVDQCIEVANPAAVTEPSADDDKEERDLRDRYFLLFGRHAGGRMKIETLREKVSEVEVNG